MFCRCGITILLSAVCLSAPVDNDSECVDETLGVWLASNGYSCEHLIDSTKHPLLGIYGDRYNLCHQTTTNCCATCKTVLAEYPDGEEGCVDGVEGITLADSTYNCSLLLNPDPKYNKIGIYGDNINVCKWKVTQCCATCAVVRQNAQSTAKTDAQTSQTTSLKTEMPTQKPAAPTTRPPPLTDMCSRNCLWVADGLTGTCSDLIGISLALSLCQDPENFDRCQATCTTVIQQAGQAEEQPFAEAQKHTTTTTSTTIASVRECRDAGFTFRGNRYENCQDLNTPWILPYSRQICDSNECCSTCKKLNAKPANNENDTGKQVRPSVQVSELSEPMVKHVFNFFMSFQQMLKDFSNFQLKAAV